MGLFDRLSGRNDTSEQPRQKALDMDLLDGLSGMRAEVYNEYQQMLFIARASVSMSGVMYLEPLTEDSLYSEDGGSVRVRLRGFSEKQQKAVRMEGDITPSANNMWRVEQLRILSKENDRSFFRQEIDVEGKVMQMDDSDAEEHPCRLVNISAGGLCINIRSNADFKVGTKLLVKSNLLPSWQNSPLLCIVRRKVEKQRGATYEYGCEFQDLNPQIENQIVKTIMEMQRQRIKR